MRQLITETRQLLLGSLHRRRIVAVRNRENLLHHIGNFPRIGHDHLIGGLGVEIVELRKHFLGRAHVKRNVLVRVGKLLTGK